MLKLTKFTGLAYKYFQLYSIRSPAYSHKLLYTENGFLSGPDAVSFIALLFIVLCKSASIAALATSHILGTLVRKSVAAVSYISGSRLCSGRIGLGAGGTGFIR